METLVWWGTIFGFSYHLFIWNFLIFLVDSQLFIFVLFSKIENEIFWFEKKCMFLIHPTQSAIFFTYRT
jgi:hypothetical protein